MGGLGGLDVGLTCEDPFWAVWAHLDAMTASRNAEAPFVT
jgi:hypothetical protein